jgi:polyisoprenyl-teichoic acid--peptidoglycan teichoic acid transferase
MNKTRHFIAEISNKNLLLVIGLLLISYLGIFVYLIYSILLFAGIETFLRIILILTLTIFAVFFIIGSYKVLVKNQTFGYVIFIAILLLFGLLQLWGAHYVNKVYQSISNLNKTEVTYSTSLISLSESNIKKLGDVKDLKIGIIDDKNSVDGYVISKEIIAQHNLDKTNNIIEYESFIEMLNDLYDGEVSAIFISSNYTTMFSSIEHFEKINEDTHVIISKSKQLIKRENEDNNTAKNLTEPFTLLILGLDSTLDDIHSGSAFNGDALLLVTFNPTTLNSTILSIPRDTYVPIMCFRNQIKNKITHAAWYGESCVIKTVENFTGINIDYYLKINFKGVVQLVDTIDGVDVDVPLSFCEQDSNRRKGNHLICIDKGQQKLDGEQALALTRHRKTIDDIRRGLNQQLVLAAILDKIKEINNVNKVYSLLKVMERNMDTNLTTNQILSFYNIGKDIISHNKTIGDNQLISFNRLYLQGYDQYIYDEGMKLPLYNYVYYEGSLKDIVDAMKVNLGLKESESIKTFSFSINSPYEQKLIGKGNYYGEKKIQVVPDFKPKDKNYAIDWGRINNIKITFETVDSNDDQHKHGQIINQSIPAYSLINRVNQETGITLTVVNKPVSIQTTKTNCYLEENKALPLCFVPNLSGEPINKLDTWLNNITSNFIVTRKTIETDNILQDSIIKEQSALPNTKVSDIGLELIITYYIFKEAPNE